MPASKTPPASLTPVPADADTYRSLFQCSDKDEEDDEEAKMDME